MYEDGLTSKFRWKLRHRRVLICPPTSASISWRRTRIRKDLIAIDRATTISCSVFSTAPGIGMVTAIRKRLFDMLFHIVASMVKGRPVVLCCIQSYHCRPCQFVQVSSIGRKDPSGHSSSCSYMDFPESSPGVTAMASSRLNRLLACLKYQRL